MNDYGAGTARNSLMSAEVTTRRTAVHLGRPVDTRGHQTTGEQRRFRLILLLLLIFHTASPDYAFAATTGRRPKDAEKAQNRPENPPDETISRNPRNRPETDEAYISCHQMAHRRLGGIT
ncbi:hypothetical protein [Bradyrhizobium sp. JYMT SZCCT0428]|uniref:hypothetical protein n=1 Tax=Bradyrhizobium sp. JYMT SZCCT0428 TaxID=2807673 RepID=UPI001BACBA63|nr:hypothetical protein [Bradyrhizobium sp. JYMT SZCCT0428]MBR1150057.1 hypothetical protein [Bradyrhizobium sp. JYMT SZCCT0428]